MGLHIKLFKQERPRCTKRDSYQLVEWGGVCYGENVENKPLNANALKLIAIVAMTVDHLAWAMWPGSSTNNWALLMHVIGRLTFPMMCFFVAEGYQHTRNFAKYLGRMLLFAVIAHFAYVFYTYQDLTYLVPFAHGRLWNQTSVMWGLASGLLLIKVWDTQMKVPLKLLATLPLLVLALPADWNYLAPLLILMFWANRGHFARQMWCLMGLVLLDSLADIFLFGSNLVYAVLQLAIGLCVPVLWLYNGQRGKSPRLNRFWKWFFYLYYPLHLTVLGLLICWGVFPI